MTITWICATMIQSHWRSYHVRRQRMDKYAMMIQRHCRGFLVRSVLKSHTAAVTIQRRVAGVLTRKRLAHLHKAASRIESTSRGRLARKRFVDMKAHRLAVIITLQKHIRAWMARRRAKRAWAEKRFQATKRTATVELQRMFRGWKGRQFAEQRRQEVNDANLREQSAMRIQTMYRNKKARVAVNDLRIERHQEMEKAATFVRKVWLGAKMRKKYNALKEEFGCSEDCVIVIQRYMRGCLCRVRLWYKAVQHEEQLWAAIEIQRRWRGFLGRRRWIAKRELGVRWDKAAALLQPNIRGFLARRLVCRMRRKLARAEFEWARARYRAAQKIQTLVRGVQVRMRFREEHARATRAATNIQRIQRGRALRARMWSQVREQNAATITAAARGYLVRKRRQHLLAKVICIQRAYRVWLRVPAAERNVKQEHMMLRKAKATTLQKFYRQHAETNNIKRIQAATI
jgi:hypothetical protein